MLGSRGVAGRARSARERVTRRGSRVVIIASGERAKLRRATSAPDEPCVLQPRVARRSAACATLRRGLHTLHLMSCAHGATCPCTAGAARTRLE